MEQARILIVPDPFLLFTLSFLLTTQNSANNASRFIPTSHAPQSSVVTAVALARNRGASSSAGRAEGGSASEAEGSSALLVAVGADDLRIKHTHEEDEDSWDHHLSHVHLRKEKKGAWPDGRKRNTVKEKQIFDISSCYVFFRWEELKDRRRKRRGCGGRRQRHKEREESRGERTEERGK